MKFLSFGTKFKSNTKKTIRETTTIILICPNCSFEIDLDEMIADASDNITLQVLLSLPELSVNTAIRRMYLIASSMHRDAMSALAELNYELAKEVIRSDDEVDRFSLYVIRNLVMAMQNGRVLREMGLKNPLIA
jgi:phosphate uptake regulator